MIDSAIPVVELTTTRSKIVLTFEKSVFLAPGTLVTVHTAGEKKGHKHFTTQINFIIDRHQYYMWDVFEKDKYLPSGFLSIRLNKKQSQSK